MQTTSERPIDPREFSRELSKIVKGQPEAIEYLAYMARIYDIKRRAAAFSFLSDNLAKFPRVVLLLTGDTGGGKTFLVKNFAKLLNLPYTKLDCSQITGDGWVGTSVSDVVGKHLSKCKQGYGVLHLDEFDKILPSNGTSARSGSEANFLAAKMSSFLELIDGDFTAIPNERSASANAKMEEVNNSLIICSGSFQQVRDKDSEIKTPIGFIQHEIEEIEKSLDWKDRMDELGYLKELAGRISHSIELKPYSKEDILDILLTGEDSVYQEYLNTFGRGHELTREELEAIADKAAGSKAGLRVLNSLMFETYFRKGIWK